MVGSLFQLSIHYQSSKFTSCDEINYVHKSSRFSKTEVFLEQPWLQMETTIFCIYVFIKSWYINTYQSSSSQIHLSQYFFILLYWAVMLRLVVVGLSCPLGRQKNFLSILRNNQQKTMGLTTCNIYKTLF